MFSHCLGLGCGQQLDSDNDELCEDHAEDDPRQSHKYAGPTIGGTNDAAVGRRQPARHPEEVADDVEQDTDEVTRKVNEPNEEPQDNGSKPANDPREC